LAQNEKSVWKKFEHLKKALGNTDYTSAVREAFQDAGKAKIPNLYLQLWELGINGFFTLNIDRLTGQHPKVGQHLYVDWNKLLNEKVCSIKCDFWKSLPRRTARLINWSTKDNQSERWDVTRIHGELIRLSEAQKGASQVTSAEMFAEEIAARCPELVLNYIWDDQKLSALSELRSGFVIRVVGNESEKKVELHIDWMQTGERNYENVRKYIETAAEKSCSRLKKGAWKISQRGIALGECHIKAEATVSELRKPELLDATAIGLNESISSLRFG
jgi:hypothetical protein